MIGASGVDTLQNSPGKGSEVVGYQSECFLGRPEKGAGWTNNS